MLNIEEIKARLKRGEYYVPYAPEDISALLAEVERLQKQLAESQRREQAAVHAHIVGRGYDLHCSNCGASADIGNDCCPSCGAKMDGKEGQDVPNLLAEVEQLRVELEQAKKHAENLRLDYVDLNSEVERLTEENRALRDTIDKMMKRNMRIISNNAAKDGEIERLREAQRCGGCLNYGQYENEMEYGYPSPCTRCVRRAPDNFMELPAAPEKGE